MELSSRGSTVQIVLILAYLYGLHAASYQGKLPYNRYKLGRPGQVRFSFGANATQCVISWVSVADHWNATVWYNSNEVRDGKNASVYYGEVQYAYHPSASPAPASLPSSSPTVKSYASVYTDNRCGTNRVMHSVNIPNCVVGANWVLYRVRTLQTYESDVLPATDWSRVYAGKMLSNSPQQVNAAIIGDMSDDPGSSLPTIAKAVATHSLNVAVHMGDVAYDIDDRCGSRGDEYMNAMENITSAIPYVVGPGDHEEGRQHTASDGQLQNGYDYSAFHMRFGRATNAGQLIMARASLSPSLHYFSFDRGYVHWIVLNTNAYIHHQLYWLAPIQYHWLLQDLARVDRSTTPWVLVSQHRSMYCVKTTDNECNSEAASIREGIPLPALQANINAEEYPATQNTRRLYSLEDAFHQYGVDVVFSGHTHHYQRSYPVYREEATQFNYEQPKATVYVVAGICGAQGHDPFTLPMAEWEAYRDPHYYYSYGHFRVYNHTHATYYQRFASNNSVLDEFTIVKGPASRRRRRRRGNGGPSTLEIVLSVLVALLAVALIGALTFIHRHRHTSDTSFQNLQVH